jgi:hypothetical protein
MAGTRYGTRDVFLNTSWCAIKSRTDYVNRYVARMGFSELVDVTRASNRRLLGCAEGTRDGVIESYSSDASRPEPVVFHFDPAVAAQGIEILPELDDAERAPTTFEVSGSNDNVNWTAVFSEKTAREPLRAGEAIASWFGNTTPYSWYRVDLTGNGTSASIAASAIRLRTELPEARTVSDVILMDAEEEALARLAEFEAFEGADAIRERPTIIQPTGPIAQPGPGQAAGAPIDSVTLLRQTYNVVDLVVGAGQGGRWLTYADGWHPAWIAHVDGQPQPVARANVGFKAVWVEPGIHRVTLEFENRAFFWKYCALAALMMGAFIWGLAYFVGARRAL